MSEVEKHLKDAVQKHLSADNVTWANVVLVCMNIAEDFASKTPGMGGKEKKRFAKDLVVKVIKACMQEGYTSVDNAEILLLTNDRDGEEEVGSLIDTFIFVSKHPAFIQFRQAVKKHYCLSSKKASK